MVTLVHGNDQLKIDHTPVAAVAGGDVISRAGKLCIAPVPLEANESGAVAYPNGGAVYQGTKASGSGIVFAEGADVFWDIAGGSALAAGGDGKIGVAVVAAADGDSSVEFVHE